MLCKIFSAIEDELFQQVVIMGLSLRRIKRSTKMDDVRKYAVIGTKAADKVDKILRQARDKTDHCNSD